MKQYQRKMLARGWIAVRDLSGKIVHWSDQTEPKNVWPDWEAKAFHGAGDCGSVPPLRRPERLEARDGER